MPDIKEAFDMRPTILWIVLAAFIGALFPGHASANSDKRRIFIVSSYHKEYLWSQSTQSGLSTAMLDFSYLDDPSQMETLAEEDRVESSTTIVHKVWMDTKRRNTRRDIALATARIMDALYAFEPDLVFLGDDNAAHYIGTQLLDTDIPVVFWGINGLPLKYGLVDSMDQPGHNVTGVWQAGYHKESLTLLSRLVPGAKTFAILACDSVSSRPNVKILERLAAKGDLPLELVDTVVTNSFEEFKARAKALSMLVDAFFVLNHDTLIDDTGEHVDMLSVGRWYLENIDKPEASHEDQFVREGMLLTANDSGFNQAYSAFEMAYDIIEQGLSPARIRVRTPPKGPYLVNSQRAEQLDISLEDSLYMIDEIITESAALSG